MYRYSQTTGNFYPDAIYYPPDTLPDDLIWCTEEVYAVAMNKPPGATLAVVDGKLAIRPPPAGHALEAARSDALMRIESYSKSKRLQIAGTSDNAEIAAWNNKLRIAQAIQAGTASNADRATFQTEVDARGVKGETVETFVQKVLRNAAFYAQAVALIDGFRRSAQDAINAARTPEEVAAALASAKTRAEASYASLMAASGG